MVHLLRLNASRWYEKAACHGKPTDWWFPSKSNAQPGDNASAKSICRFCPVVDDCLEYAMRYPLTHIALPGIYAGMTERERQFRALLFEKEMRKK
jgi:WhiB family transcriptional regulator, redox-sensing transcriptional regulator